MNFKRGQLVRIARLHSGYIDGVGVVLDEVPNKENKLKIKTGDLVLYIEIDRLQDEKEAIEKGRFQYKEECESRAKSAFNARKWKERWGDDT